MPEPLHSPAMRTSLSSDLEPRKRGLLHHIGGEDGLRHLLKRSDSAPSGAASAGIAAISFSAGRGTPIMPVDEGKTSSALQWKTSAAALHVACAALRPACPAAQLALPAFTATTRTLPPVALKCSLSTISGAAVTRLAVNAAAALAGSSATISAKSVRPLAFRGRGRRLQIGSRVESETGTRQTWVGSLKCNPSNLAGCQAQDGPAAGVSQWSLQPPRFPRLGGS